VLGITRGLLHPEATAICGIAVEPRLDEISEDAIYLDARTWDAWSQQHARELYERTGWFSQASIIEGREWEFPIPEDKSP
jgi:hypothetical protein